MSAFLLRSFIRALFIMIFVMTIAFVFLRFAPIDPAQYLMGDHGTTETLSKIRAEMGLDRPIYVQFISFFGRLLHGDLGNSLLNKQSVISQLKAVLPYTVELVISAVIFGIVLGVPPGILAALRPNGIADQIIRVVTLVGISVPIYVSGIFIIIVFSLKLDLLPAIGGGEPGNLKSQLLHLVLPAFSCGIIMMASVARLTRASLLDVLNKDYIMTARSKGLKERIVILKHALRNALLPLITFLGIEINILLGSAVIVEVIFTRPGVGRLIVEGIKSCDFPVVQTIIMLYAGTVVIINLLIDITYSVVDPRIVK